MNVSNKISCLLGFFFIGLLAGVRAQTSLDSVQLRNVKGKMVSYSSLTHQSPLVMVCFWSINSESSIRELTAINQRYAKLKQPLNFTLLAICVDEGNLLNHMRNTALQNEWTFEVYADIDGELQHAFHFTNVPQSLIVNKGEIVYQQSGFEPGSENYLFSKIQSLATPPRPR
ncbi:MAG: redoxin domain-containing protein [Chitinophagaceae bacterium]|nr:redoxin domain-containing protein [Chitinophagaceae bacterium]